MIWFAILIPIIAAIVMMVFFRKETTWWELAIPIAASTLFILILKFGVETSMQDDKEYWGSLVVEARYYEYWETWVTKTCSYESCSGSGKDRHCTTIYYDCSYCNHNPAHWEAVDNTGRTFSISESYYNKLMKQWSATPQFVELNRDIDKTWRCGKDGDMYSIKWDKQISTSEAAVTEHPYTNKVQMSHSAFKMEVVEDKEADSLGLYKYPKEYSFYKQETVLGLDKINYWNKAKVQKEFEYLNGYRGPINKVKIFVLLFVDKPFSIAEKQKAYWDGGNKNELVICIGINKDLTINWVSPFSWTDNKRILVECREEIAELKVLNFDALYGVLDKAVPRYFKYKDFKDFNYLTVDLPNWCIWVAYIGTLLLSLGLSYFVTTNEFKNET